MQPSNGEITRVNFYFSTPAGSRSSPGGSLIEGYAWMILTIVYPTLVRAKSPNKEVSLLVSPTISLNTYVQDKFEVLH